jgi:hypothetical protein
MRAGTRAAALAAALAIGLTPGQAEAQYTSTPFIITPNQDPQDSSIKLIAVTLRGDYGFAPGEYSPISGRVVLNWGRVSFSGGAGVLYDPDLDDDLTLGASVGYDFYTAKLIHPTITLQAAVGYSERSSAAGSFDQWDIPAGIGVSWPFGPPDPPLNLELWAAPLVHLRVLDSDSNLGFGFSLGLNLLHVPVSWPFNLGVQSAIEELWIGDPSSSGLHNEFTASIGIQVRWTTLKIS